jgi:hypothetical protein
MTPLAVRVLIHAYYCPTPFPEPGPGYHSAAAAFERLGVLLPREGDGKAYQCTSKGEAWVKAICNTPCPVSGDADESVGQAHPDEPDRLPTVIRLNQHEWDLYSEESATREGYDVRMKIRDLLDDASARGHKGRAIQIVGPGFRGPFRDAALPPEAPWRRAGGLLDAVDTWVAAHPQGGENVTQIPMESQTATA